MGGFGVGGYNQGRSVRPEPMHYIKLSGVKTELWTDKAGNTHLKLHDTVVVSFNDKWITLRTGGWKTMMTKGRMNWASNNFGLGFTVFSESSRKRLWVPTISTEGIIGTEIQVAPGGPSQFRRLERSMGDWFVEFQGSWPFENDKISLNRETHEVVEKDMVDPTDDIYHCKRQRRGFSSNPGRARSSNIAMAGEDADEDTNKGSDDIDVEVDDQGSIILFRLVTSAARGWWKENVSEGLMHGDRHVVEHRYAGDIVEGMMADGLNVNAR